MIRLFPTTVFAVLLVAAISSGCSTSNTPTGIDLLQAELGNDVPPVPSVDPQVAATGADLYQANCASCHGNDLSGADDWKTPDQEGRYPPPPLDDTGHAWHHPDQLLTDIVLDGSSAPESAMVGFRDRLSESDVEAVLEYLKSTWGTEERQFQWVVTWQESERDG